MEKGKLKKLIRSDVRDGGLDRSAVKDNMGGSLAT